MPSRYCIIRYVPNPLTEERVNVGVIAYDDTQVRVRFLERWNRVKHFAGRDITFLRDLARVLLCAACRKRQGAFYVHPGSGRSVHPVIGKVGGSVDRVNGQLDKVDRVTEGAVDAA